MHLRRWCAPTEVRRAELIATERPVTVTEPRITQVLAGARNGAPQAGLRRLLLRFHLCRSGASAGFEGAARIYRRWRQAGIPGHSHAHHSVATIYRPPHRLLACPPTQIPNTYPETLAKPTHGMLDRGAAACSDGR